MRFKIIIHLIVKLTNTLYICGMEAITVFTANAEEGRILKAFLKALNMRYKPTPAKTLEALEGSLTPAQRTWWLELKANIIAVKKGEIEDDGMDLEDFLNNIENADKTPHLVSA